VGQLKNTYKFLVRKPEGTILLVDKAKTGKDDDDDDDDTYLKVTGCEAKCTWLRVWPPPGHYGSYGECKSLLLPIE
jgi:hypothetical protein